jgi:ComEC/Rec2-related protein
MQSLAQVLPVMRVLVIPFALSLALGYGLIAGMGLPVQRALVMFVCASLLLLLRRQVAWLDLWMLALLVVVVTNPLASYTPGYYLSFGAVAMLLYGFGGRRRLVRQPPSQQWLVALLRSQWLVGVGMTPLLLLLVAQCSGLSLIANLVAIPVISLLIVPLLLLTLIALLWSPALASVPLGLATPIMSTLWQYRGRRRSGKPCLPCLACWSSCNRLAACRVGQACVCVYRYCSTRHRRWPRAKLRSQCWMSGKA